MRLVTGPRCRRCRRAALVATAALAATLAGCAPRGALPPGDPDLSHLPLETFVLTPVDSTGQVRPSVRVAAPYSSLIFHSTPAGGYVAGLVVQVTAWRDDMQVGGGVRADTVRVPDFTATRSERELRLDVPVTVRGEGPVEFEVRATVKESVRRWHRRLAYSPRAAATMPLYIADVQTNLAALRGGSLALAGEDTLHVAVVLRRPTREMVWPPGGLFLAATASSPGAAAPLRWRRELARPDVGDALHVALDWPARELPFGRLELSLALEAVTDDDRERLPHEPPLEIVVLRVPFREDRAWKRHLMWLEGTFPEATLDSLATVASADRAAAWNAAWAQYADPSGEDPRRVEQTHLLRIVAADERFGQFGRGALSDRGRVFIRHGEPDRIERYGDDLSRTGVWEVWTYRDLGRRFLFYDAHGVGDFRLSEERPY